MHTIAGSQQLNFCQSLKIYDEQGESIILDPAKDDRYKSSSDFSESTTVYELRLDDDRQS